MFVNTILWWSTNLYYYLIQFYTPELGEEANKHSVQRNDYHENQFEVVYQWTYLNYTWQSMEQYNQAIQSGKYIPANNAPTGIKFYQNKMYLTIPRLRQGIPATLVYLDMNDGIYHKNSLLTPYPNWELNVPSTSCSNLQSVQSMEVDTRGIMWVIDGVRINNYTRCPAKLVLLDLNIGGKVVHTYQFPERQASRNGGFLNDIVVDETNGNFAYITDNSQTDPGIIVYSRRKNQSWKLRDRSMLPEPNVVKFSVENVIFNSPTPVDGIALSPLKPNGEKTLFYCAISSFTIYSLSTRILKNRKIVKAGRWRHSIRREGEKAAQSDGIIIDEQANMYLTMLPQYGVAKWNIDRPFSTMRTVDSDRKKMVWPDGFGFDQQGFLYVISNKIFIFFDASRTPMITNDAPFRVWRSFTGTRSYLYG